MYVAILHGAIQRSRSGIKSRMKPVNKLIGIIQKKLVILNKDVLEQNLIYARYWRTSVRSKLLWIQTCMLFEEIGEVRRVDETKFERNFFDR